MGAQREERINTKTRIHILGANSPVAQMLHPLWIDRTNLSAMGDILSSVDRELSTKKPEVRLVVGGGGFLEIDQAEPYRFSLNGLIEFVQVNVKPLADILKNSKCEYVFGVDVFDGDDRGIGQFAVVLNKGYQKTIAWKSYPVVDEDCYLAGFGTPQGWQSPRFITTLLGQTAVLVCHDAQAFNHRQKALVSRAVRVTPRKQVITEMNRQMEENRPAWIFNHIHQIKKQGSIKTFRTSYKQIHEDYNHHPKVVGSFGYGKKVQNLLESIAQNAQFPNGSASVIVILEQI
jgi:hypothetical protein